MGKHKKKHLHDRGRNKDEAMVQNDRVDSRAATQDHEDSSIKNFVKLNSLPLAILVFIVMVLYANSLNNEFLSDDIGGILQNPDLNNYGAIFRSPINVIRFFHPALLITINKIFGLIPAYFRFPNILFHLGTVVMVYGLVNKLLSRQIAFFAALILAVHPMGVESVAWISGGGHVMYTFFLILALYCWVKQSDNRKYFYWSLAAFFMAITISEKSFSFPLSLLLFAWAYRVYPKNWQKYLPLVIPFAVLGIIFLRMVPERIAWLRADYYQTDGFGNPLVTTPIALASYLELLFWPDKLTLYHSELFFGKMYFALKILVSLVYAGLTVYLLKKERKIGFWLAFFGTSLAPVLLMANFGIAWIVAERYVYCAAIGVYVFAAWLLVKLGQKLKNQEITWVIVGLLVVVLSIRTVVRNNDWQNQDTLWVAAARTSPSSAQNHNNLGDMYARQGNYPRAIEEFSIAIRLKSNYGDAYHNLANIYHLIKRDDLALANYQKALEFNPKIWQSHQNMAFIYYSQGEYIKAEENLALAVAINPGNSGMRSAYGITLLKNNRIAEAQKEFEIAVALDPHNEQAQAFLLRIRENFKDSLP